MRSAAELAESLWYGESAAARAGRGLLAPLGWAFTGVATVRGRLYDRGLLAVARPAIPALGVGNLTVGGTGKTPVAAELARRLREAGASPAVVLRGYGDDEPLVHATLNPDVRVVTGADRAAAVARAAAAGADVAVLDDAFQHRRLARHTDIVLVSADRWSDTAVRGLPAGPFREPLAALRRASLALVTRKAAADERVAAAIAAIGAAAPGCPTAVARLELGELVAAEGGERRPLSSLRGLRIVAATAIGDPRAFLSQIAAGGARVTPLTWPDHHAFSDHDVERLVQAGKRADAVVCTLKDAVKLAPRWPRAAAGLWYVSQKVVFERGEDRLEHLLADLLRTRIPLP